LQDESHLPPPRTSHPELQFASHSAHKTRIIKQSAFTLNVSLLTHTVPLTIAQAAFTSPGLERPENAAACIHRHFKCGNEYSSQPMSSLATDLGLCGTFFSHSAPSLPMFLLEFCGEVNHEETRVMGLSSSEDHMIVAGSCFGMIPDCDGRSDRRTVRRTVRQNLSWLRQRSA